MGTEIILDDVADLNPAKSWRIRSGNGASDCQAGQFKIGATHFRGPKLDMELIGAQISEGEYFGYPLQKWLALLFVDPDGVLSCILFKTESLDNFEELRRTLSD